MGEKTGPIRGYRDLIAWKEAMDIAEAIYVSTRAFPREEAFGLTAQMRRAASSVPANIAEGFGRAQRRSFIQYLRIAQGSLKELESHTMLACRVGLLGNAEANEFAERYSLLGKRLVSYVRSLERSATKT